MVPEVDVPGCGVERVLGLLVSLGPFEAAVPAELCSDGVETVLCAAETVLCGVDSVVCGIDTVLVVVEAVF